MRVQANVNERTLRRWFNGPRRRRRPLVVRGPTWDAIEDLDDDGAGARLDDTTTGPRTIWFGPEAARVVAAPPQRRTGDRDRVFPRGPGGLRLRTAACTYLPR